MKNYLHDSQQGKHKILVRPSRFSNCAIYGFKGLHSIDWPPPYILEMKKKWVVP